MSGISYVNQLNQSLNDINNELTSSISLELDRLKDEEKYLQNALQLKTRQNLIHTLEKDLEMDNLKSTSFNLNTSGSSPQRLQQLMSQNIDQNKNLEHYLTHDLNEDCKICSRKNHILINTLLHSNENLRSFFKDSIKKNKSKEKYEPPVKPNVVNYIIFSFEYFC